MHFSYNSCEYTDPKKLIIEMIKENIFTRLITSHKLYPGDAIKELSSQNRALLETLKSDDIANVKWPLYRWQLEIECDQHKTRKNRKNWYKLG